MESEKEKFFKKLNNILCQLFPEAVDRVLLSNYQFFKWHKTYITYTLKPIKNPKLVEFNDLIGLDKIKEKVYNNTLQFINGFPANNVLLWGERGCGKSSLIKSLIKEFSNYNLKLVEVKREDINSIEHLFEILSEQPYKFIIFLDDISFNTENQDYKSLKSMLDGSLIENNDNILIYATSNRRHLVKENFEENNEIHTFEAISEKISLSDRFGISLGIYKPDKETYLKIVNHYVNKFSLNDFFNQQDALNFAMYKGGFTGRSAYQYIVDLFGNKKNGNSSL